MAVPATPAEFTAAVRSAARAAAREFLDEQAAAAPPPAPDAPDPVYPDAESFYRDYFSPVFARDPKLPVFRWCSEPFRHPEFTEAMGALWSSWEFLRASDPAMGLAVWLVNYAYPLLDRLSFSDGTFMHCRQRVGGHDEDATVRSLAETDP